jgi:N-acyl-phosphatidylethanolamine-hydrolysing phospholipase D
MPLLYRVAWPSKCPSRRFWYCVLRRCQLDRASFLVTANLGCNSRFLLERLYIAQCCAIESRSLAVARTMTALGQLSRSWRRQVQHVQNYLQTPSPNWLRRRPAEIGRQTSTTASVSKRSTSARNRCWSVGSPLAATTGTWQPDVEAASATPNGADAQPASTTAVRAHHVLDSRGHLKGFQNPWTLEAQVPTLGELWRLTRVWDSEKSRVTPAQRRALEAAACQPDWSLIERAEPSAVAVAATWIGHASFILQFRDHRPEQDKALQADAVEGPYPLADSVTTVYLDPVFSDRASPFSFIGPKRLVKATPLDECPLPQLVCISHNHYDHCDIHTIRALVARARSQHRSITWLVPLGVRSLLRDQSPLWGGQVPSSHPVHELDWYEQCTVGTLQVTLVPAQHSTGRTMWDRNRTLWGGWILRHVETDTRCYFAGDTAYRIIDETNRGYPYPTEEERRKLAASNSKRKPCPVFRTIGDQWGPFDLAMIPIGAYSPRWFMSKFHIDPVDAVAIHRDVRARLSVAMHHSTFVLTDEGLEDPERRLADALSDVGLGESDFAVWHHGETRLVCREKVE